jgi:ribosomal protein L34E
MTHWKKLTNPNYLGAYSIENGQDLILTIDYIKEEKVTGTDGKKDDCVVCHFKENAKPMILNATNMKTITKLFGTPYIEDWSGRQIQIGTEKIKAFGDIVDALRVRKKLPQVQQPTVIKCENCGNNIQPVGRMTAEQTSQYTKKKYGQSLCSECATKAKEMLENATE